MIQCGVNRIWLVVSWILPGLYVVVLFRILMSGDGWSFGQVTALTVLFAFPIYLALFQVKTIKIENGQMKVFYPFRMWTVQYELGNLENWKYRKTTKVTRFEFYLRSRYVVMKFKDSSWMVVLFSLWLTNFDDLLAYLNERHKDARNKSWGTTKD